MMAAEARTGGVSLDWLLEDLLAESQLTGVDVYGLAADSRCVRPGDLFFATRGLQVHGLEYVGQAVARGAVAVLWEPADDHSLGHRVATLPVPAIAVPGLGYKAGVIADRFYAHPTRHMQVIGVTGTDGKTTVSHFIAQALSSTGCSCGLLGTLGYGVYGALRPPTHTTPDALRLQSEFAALRDQAVQQVAMEVSSHALHQRRTAGVAFDIAVLTQLSRDHLDYHGSVEAYADAKRRLFETPGLQAAVLNLDDGFGRQLAGSLRHRLRIVACQRNTQGGAREFADWIELQDVRPLEKGVELRLVSSWGEAAFTAPVLGEFSADNLLVSLGALLASGLSLQAAVRGLSRVSTVPGRMELFVGRNTPRVVVDYAHTPHALQAALTALRPHCVGDLVCVFGAGGDRDQGKRPLMGAVAERLADRVILTSDNPRSEEPDSIIDQIAQGFAQPLSVERIPDRTQAIAAALREAHVGDLVLVAGKGHENYQQVGREQRPFSDRTKVQELLRGISR